MKLRMLNNNHGCFGGGAKTPDIPAAPAPTPVPTPSEVSSQQTPDQRSNQIKNLQYGVLSTIKTGAAGITGNGPDLNTPIASAGQKKTLGS